MHNHSSFISQARATKKKKTVQKMNRTEPFEMKSNAHQHSRTDERATRELKDNNNKHLTTTTVSELSQHEILFDWHLLWCNGELNNSEMRFTNNNKKDFKIYKWKLRREIKLSKTKINRNRKKERRRHEQTNEKRDSNGMAIDTDFTIVKC